MSGQPPLDDDAVDYLYELYHKNLPPKIAEAALDRGGSRTSRGGDPDGKSYRRAPTVPLADRVDTAFLSQLEQRASYSDPTDRRPVSDTELATLLAFAYGEGGQSEEPPPRRPVPSAGACYPLELYPIVLDSPDIDRGIYHFNVGDDSLEQLQAGDYTEWVQTNWRWITEDDAIAVVILITALPARSAERYGELGYLFAGIETGSVIQNLQLVASELGIGSRPHNGLDYSAIRETLGLRADEYLMSTVAFAGRDGSEMS
jgi:SagB-type dehydrogenase family enzyme